MGNVKYHQRFYSIETKRVVSNFEVCYSCNRPCEHGKEVWVYIIVPLYVYSINRHWNGVTGFDLSPVNFGAKRNKSHDDWSWKREYTSGAIGKDIFRSRKKAQEAFNKRFTSKERQRFAKLLEPPQ